MGIIRQILQWIQNRSVPSYKVRCVDCGKVVDVNKDSHFEWDESYGKLKDKKRTLVQCVDCAEQEHSHSDIDSVLEYAEVLAKSIDAEVKNR